jgi:hypothetical protein
MLQLRAGRDGLGIPIFAIARVRLSKIDDYLADNVSFIKLSDFRLEVN